MFSLTRERARWIATVFFFLSGILSASWSSRIPDIQKKFLLNDAQWGSLLFALPAGLITGFMLSGFLVARYGARRMMVITAVFLSLTLLALGLANSTWQLAIVLFFFGMSRNATSISANTFSVEVQALYDRPIVSTFHGVWSLACFAAIAIGSFMLAYNIIPFWHFLIVSTVSILVALFYKRKKHERVAINKKWGPLFMMPDRYLFLLGMTAFCSMMCEATMFDWSVNYFKIIGAENAMVTAGYTCFILAMTLGRLLGDKIVALYGPVKMLMINGVIMAGGFFLSSFFPFFLTASIGFLLVGLGSSILVPMVYMLASKTKYMPSAYAIASVTMLGYIGFLMAPPLVGIISENFGMKWAFSLMGVLSLCIVFIALLIKKSYQTNFLT